MKDVKIWEERKNKREIYTKKKQEREKWKERKKWKIGKKRERDIYRK